jgi:hypothetical protein
MDVQITLSAQSLQSVLSCAVVSVSIEIIAFQILTPSPQNAPWQGTDSPSSGHHWLGRNRPSSQLKSIKKGNKKGVPRVQKHTYNQKLKHIPISHWVARDFVGTRQMGYLDAWMQSGRSHGILLETPTPARLPGAL